MRKTVLLTGASGVVGQALMPMIAARHELICLTHRAPVHEGVAQLPADLTQPGIGLDSHRYTDLVRRIDAVVHCAAITHFGASEQAMRNLNVSGTQRILELAEKASVPVYYLSTAFVARVNQAAARPGAAGESSPVDYLESKIAAEETIRTSGQPAVILRPSVVFGDSVTGRIARYQGLHGILAAFLSNRLPLLTMERHSRVDFVSQNVVSKAITALIDTGITRGEYWLTAGSAALTAAQMVDTGAQFARGLGLRIDTPRMVCPDVVDRLIRPVFIDALPRPDRRRFEDMYAMTSVFDTVEPFPTDLGGIPGTSAPTPETLTASLRTALRYMVRVKFEKGEGRVA
jgi:nucleoside-diphosphate-sugar epimerase